MNIIEGNLVAGNARFALVAGRFNDFIVSHLVEGAIDTIVRHGGDRDNIDLIKVPGAFEMPVAVKRVAESKKYDAIICLGAVIRGGTPHFEYVAGECVKGIASVAGETGLPISFGVLTVDTIEQAIERAGTKAGNKGGEAAAAAIEMVNVLKAIDAACGAE